MHKFVWSCMCKNIPKNQEYTNKVNLVSININLNINLNQSLYISIFNHWAYPIEP